MVMGTVWADEQGQPIDISRKEPKPDNTYTGPTAQGDYASFEEPQQDYRTQAQGRAPPDTDEFGNVWDEECGCWVSPEGNRLKPKDRGGDGSWYSPDGKMRHDGKTWVPVQAAPAQDQRAVESTAPKTQGGIDPFQLADTTLRPEDFTSPQVRPVVEQRDDGNFVRYPDGRVEGPYAEDEAGGIANFGSIDAWNRREILHELSNGGVRATTVQNFFESPIANSLGQFEAEQQRRLSGQTANRAQSEAVGALRRMGLGNIADAVQRMNFSESPRDTEGLYGGYTYGNPDEVRVSNRPGVDQRQVAVHEGIHVIQTLLNQELGPEGQAAFEKMLRQIVAADNASTENRQLKQITDNLLANGDIAHMLTYLFDNRPGGPPPEINSILRGLDAKIEGPIKVSPSQESYAGPTAQGAEDPFELAARPQTRQAPTDEWGVPALSTPEPPRGQGLTPSELALLLRADALAESDPFAAQEAYRELQRNLQEREAFGEHLNTSGGAQGMMLVNGEWVRSPELAAAEDMPDYLSPFLKSLDVEIPYAKDVREGLGDALRFVGDAAQSQLGPLNTAADAFEYVSGKNLPSLGDVTELGKYVVPTTTGELALEFVPGIGMVPGGASFVRQAGREGIEAAARASFGLGARAADDVVEGASDYILRRGVPVLTEAPASVGGARTVERIGDPVSRRGRAIAGGAEEPTPQAIGDAVMSLRNALREGKGGERAAIVKAGRKTQAENLTDQLAASTEQGLQGLELAREAGRAGAGKILPEGGIGFKLADEAIDPLINKAFQLQKDGVLSIWEAVYGVPKALEEGRLLGPTPAQAKLLSKLTDIDEMEFAELIRQRNVFEAASKGAMADELAKVAPDAAPNVRAQYQAARRAEIQADRAAALGKSEQAAKLREKAAQHRKRAEALQKDIDDRGRIAEIRKLTGTIDREIARESNNFNKLQEFKLQTIADNEKALASFKEKYLKAEAKLLDLRNQKQARELADIQEQWDKAQRMRPLQAVEQEKLARDNFLSQMTPPDMSPQRIAAQTEQFVRNLNEAGISSQQSRDALEILRYHHEGNRAILDSIRNPEGFGAHANVVRGTFAGEFNDSFLSALTYRNMALGHALRETGMDPDIAAKVANAVMNQELHIRYGDTVPQRILDELSKAKGAPYNESLAGLELAVQRWKNLVFSIDAGVFGVQVLTALRRGGVNMLAGGINKTLAMLNLPHVETFTRDVALDKKLRNIVDGVHVGAGQSPVDAKEGTLFSYFGSLGKGLDDKILNRALDRVNQLQFGNVMGWVGDQAYEGNLVMLHLLGRDISNPAVRQQAADISNHIKSFAKQALTSKRRGLERAGLTSAAMTRSQVANLLDMSKLLRPDASPEQRILAATLIASQAAYYLTLGKFINDQVGITDFVFNPGESGFGQITTDQKDSNGRNMVISVFPQASLERAIASSFQALAASDEEDALEAWGRYFTGRGSVVGRGVGAIGGVGYSPSRGFVTDLTSGERALTLAPLPPIVSSVLSRGFDVKRSSLDFLGISSFPESDSTRRDRERDATAQALFGKPYSELFQDQQNKVDTDSSVSPWVSGARESSAQRGSIIAQNQLSLQDFRTTQEDLAAEIDKMVASGEITPQEARQRYDNRERDLAVEAGRLARSAEAQAAIREIEKNRKDLSYAEQAQLDYYAIFDRPGIYDASGEFNYAAYKQGLDEWQQKYPSINKEQVAPSKPLSPGHAELEAARSEINKAGWWGSYDQAFVALKSANPDFAKIAANYDNYDEFRGELEKAARAAGVTDEDAISDLIFRLENDMGLTEAINFVQAYKLKQNPKIIPLLQKWYDLDAGEIKALAEMMEAK